MEYDIKGCHARDSMSSCAGLVLAARVVPCVRELASNETDHQLQLKSYDQGDRSQNDNGPGANPQKSSRAQTL